MAEAHITIQTSTELQKDVTGEGGQCMVCEELIFLQGYQLIMTNPRVVELLGHSVVGKVCQSCGDEAKERGRQIEYDEKHPKAEGQPQWN